MIEKNIFFIWIGEQLPTYHNVSINAFKTVNPGFNVNLIHINNINDTTNSDFNEYALLTKTDGTFYNKMLNRAWSIEKLTNSQSGNNANYSDGFRFFIINKYGGIYLDLDTFPVKPFGDFLLSHKNFMVSRFPNIYDIFFFGSKSKNIFNNFINFDSIKNRFTADPSLTISYPQKLLDYNRKQFKLIKDQFLNNTIAYQNSVYKPYMLENYYIDHFFVKTWAIETNNR